MAQIQSFRKILGTLFFALLLSSCTTDIDWKTRIDKLISGQSYVIPIGETTLTLNEIITQLDSIHFVEPGDNYIFLKFNDTIVWDFNTISKLDNLEALNVEFKPNSSTFSFPIANQTLTREFTHVISFDFNTDLDGQLVERSEINSTKVEIIVKTENLNIKPSDLRITTIFPSETLIFAPGGNPTNGVGSSYVFNPTILNQPEVVTLNPYTLLTPNSLSTLNLKVRLELLAGNTPIIVNPGSKITLSYRLYDLDAKVFYGKFKPTIKKGIEQETIDMSEYIKELPSSGVFKLSEPTIKIDLMNTSGLKINFLIDSIKAFSENDPSYSPVFAQFNGSKSKNVTIDRIINFGEAPVKTTFVLDHTLANGNISKFFDRFPLPDKLQYKFKVSSARVASDPLDFMTPKASVTAFLDIKIPLKLNAGSNFNLVDTLKNIDLGSLIDAQVIDKMMLLLKVTNNLPLKGELSLKFLDVNMQPVNDLKLLSDSIITAPPIDDNGVVKAGATAVSDLKILVENSQLETLRLAKNIQYTIKVESEDGRKMTFQKDNFIKLKLGKLSIAD